jgi:hypothetical protein
LRVFLFTVLFLHQSAPELKPTVVGTLGFFFEGGCQTTGNRKKYMLVLFIHGWSVRHTDTYGELPTWLEQQRGLDGLPLQVGDVYLGKYISFDDAVTVDDIARAFQHAIVDTLGSKLTNGRRFACITHSTGGPVVRKWMDLYYRDQLDKCPMSHLLMLAPANHGSALAQLGKSRLSRMKCLLEGIKDRSEVEPGQRVLDWLELGSDGAWELNTNWLDYDCVKQSVFPFVLTGQSIDRSMYDTLNSYTDEAGSDGVVRVASANLNYSLLRLQQDGNTLRIDKHRRCVPTALGVLPCLSHSGDDMGIIRSVKLSNASQHQTAQWVLRCLRVDTQTAYRKLADELAKVSQQTQEKERTERVKSFFGSRTYRNNRYSMVVFRITDDRGNQLEDYDLFLTAGPHYSEDHLPPGFFLDRQRNQRNRGKLTYYLDHDVMTEGLSKPHMESRIGFRLVARPEENEDSLAFYRMLKFESTLSKLEKLLVPNETLMVDLQLKRWVDATVFRLPNSRDGQGKLVQDDIARKRLKKDVQ